MSAYTCRLCRSPRLAKRFSLIVNTAWIRPRVPLKLRRCATATGFPSCSTRTRPATLAALPWSTSPASGSRMLRKGVGCPLPSSQVEQQLLESTAGQKSSVVIILDCCRVNDDAAHETGRPQRWEHGTGRLLPKPRHEAQAFVAYACEAGQSARAGGDGTSLSPFTDALLTALQPQRVAHGAAGGVRMGVPLATALELAAADVMRRAHGEQRPVFRTDAHAATPLVL